MSESYKEYGGYLEMENIRGAEYYSGVHRLNLARTALTWLLGHIKHDRVFLPKYICETVNDTANAAGYKLVSYRLDEDLNPIWGAEGSPGPDDIFYLVNYNGILSEDEVIKARESYSKVIVDNAQAFYSRPMEGVHSIYSLRKFFGVPDGAYVSSDIEASVSELPPDKSFDRTKYLVGRLEGSANEFYKESKAEELSFNSEVPRQMSLFTQNLIKGVDYEAVRDRRCSNYEVLDDLLKSDNPFTRRKSSCPYAYIYYHEDGMNLRKYLVEHKIYIPILWEPLIDEKDKGSLEYDWSSNLIWLPVDQRYDKNDMRYIAEMIKSY